MRMRPTHTSTGQEHSVFHLMQPLNMYLHCPDQPTANQESSLHPQSACRHAEQAWHLRCRLQTQAARSTHHVQELPC